MYEAPKGHRGKIVAIAILLLLSLVMLVYLLVESSSTSPTPINEENPRGSESQDTTQQAIRIDGFEDIKDALPSIADSIPNQLLQHHYTQTSKLERNAVIDDLKISDNTYTFNLTFTESKREYFVTLDVIDEEQEDYKLNIEGKK